MNKIIPIIAVISLALSSLACQSILGGGKSNGSDGVVGDEPAVTEASGSNDSYNGDGITIGGDSEFPMPSGAQNVVTVGETLTFQVEMSLEDAAQFYRDEFGKAGYTERDILTSFSDATFSIVFDGHASGKAIIVQGVDFLNGSINIAITLQDI